jgi:magnesium transporter
MFDGQEQAHWSSELSLQSGVVNCVAYHRSTGVRIGALSLPDVSEALESDPDVFVWIGLHEPSAAVMAEVQHEFGLHELAVEDATRNHQRAKVESYGDSLFVVVRTAQLSGSDIVYGATYVFLGDRYIISVRQGPSLSYVPVRAHCEQHPAKMRLGPGYVLYAILDYIVDNFLPITDQLGEHLRQQERDIFSERFSRSTLRHLYDLKSNLVRLRLAINPLQDICSYFVYHDHDDLATYFPASATPYFRDIQDHVLRSLDAVQGLSEMMQVAMDTYLALVGVGQNEIVKRLASWAAILAVPTMVASFYGMNFDYMPELHWHYGYYFALMMMLFLSVLVWRKLRKSRWL